MFPCATLTAEPIIWVWLAPLYYTAEMVRALPEDGNRYETVHGELLVTPAPRYDHQYVISEMLVLIHEYLRRYPVGQVLTSPADISWAPDVLVQPDIFVVPAADARARDWTQIKSLLLAAEVLSPSTKRYDRFTKRLAYQEFRVPDYWIVDMEGPSAEVWNPQATFPTIERERLVWHPVGAAEPLIISLAQILPRP